MATLLAACGFGETGEADRISDVSARIHGEAKSTIVGPTTYVFEYGMSTDYGSTTSVGSVDITDTSVGIPVEATITNLNEGTEYHYRLCAYAADDVGSCGDDMVLTTSFGRDSVSGTGYLVFDPANAFVLGAIIDANGEADGSVPTGQVSVVSANGVELAGQISCLQADGNRASIGLLAEPRGGGALVPWMMFIEDNGSSGDLWAATSVAHLPEACPVPSASDFTSVDFGGGLVIGPELAAGDYVVHDHTGGGG